MITWSTSRENTRTIVKIVKRARELGVNRDTLSLNMDISASHENCPLRLENLLKADDFNFLHDVCGIIRHLNRTPDELEDLFLQRFARRAE